MKILNEVIIYTEIKHIYTLNRELVIETEKDKKKMAKKTKEIQSRESAILLAEKVRLLENKEVLEIQS